MQFLCDNPSRRQAVDDHDTLNGIDYLEVLDRDAPNGSPRQRTLLVRWLKAIPADLNSANVLITGGVRIAEMRVMWAGRADGLVGSDRISQTEAEFLETQPELDHLLVVRTDTAGDGSAYRFCLAQSLAGETPPPNFDPLLSCVRFSFKVDDPSDIDREVEPSHPSVHVSAPVIDYLSKDYSSFRQLMLDRLSALLPDWQERNPADLGVTLVELLAYAADGLSYYQDAVATEAYLRTARKRVSVRRHARLLDYHMHEGCNARVWVQIQIDATQLLLERGTPLLTHVAGQPVPIQPGSSVHSQTMAEQPDVFETLHDIVLHQAQNKMDFHTWGDDQAFLPRGATRATLRNEGDELRTLAPGDVLIFEEDRAPDSGRREEADVTHRHAVRLTKVDFTEDPLFGEVSLEEDTPPQSLRVVNIAWAPADALPFPLCLWRMGNGQPVSVARGNVVLADHGETIAEAALDTGLTQGPYPLRLKRQGMTYRVPYEHEASRLRPAAEALRQAPRAALPEISLHDQSIGWTPARDLLSSDRNAKEFVVETDEDRQPSVRFGDGNFGMQPPPHAHFHATYRVGNGPAGNIGAEALAHVVTTQGGISRVVNLLPAQGGTDPEPIERVRVAAPQAFRSQERAVTETDYAAACERHPEVQKAVATRRWTGSWPTMFITVDRKAGQPVDNAFREDLHAFVERFRLAGHDVAIESPRFVALDLALRVQVGSNYVRSEVKRALQATFSNHDLPDGRQGFFHPDGFTFGESVYLSQVVAAAMEVAGVLAVDVGRFRRFGQRSLDDRAVGKIALGRLEIARLDHDPNAPENGRIEFSLKGGV